jgi:type IV pilus assembly protein PilA
MKLKEKLNQKLKKNSGFTLIEMLVVVAIIAILVVVSIPVVGSSLDKAKTATDDANMRAAKAAATVEYLTDGKNGAGTYYYDAANGALLDAAPSTGYGQSSANKDKVIKIEVTDTGKVTCTWVAKGT